MTQKGLAPILIVLILAALVGGYLVFQNQPKPTPSPQATIQPSPTSDPTTNWKTYKYNTYSVRLSDRWTQEKLLGKTQNPILIEWSIFSAKDDPYSISFQVTNDPYSLEEASRGHSKVEYITLDGQPAVKFVVIAGQEANIYQPTVQSNYRGNRFTIFISAKSNKAQTDREFNQILSTFKFLP